MCPSQPPLRPPWGGWARTLAARLGLEGADKLGLAVELLAEGPAGLAAARDLGLPPDALLDGLARPAALALGWPCRLAGSPLDAQALDALDHLVGLLTDRVGLWLDPDDDALRQRRLGPLLDLLRDAPDHGPALSLALAGRIDALPRRHEVLVALASPGVSAVVAAHWRRSLDHARAVCPRLDPLMAWLDALDAGWRHLDGVATFKGLVLSTRPRAAPPDADELGRCIDAARAYIDRPGGLRSTWELQAWGVGEHPQPLVSCWFHEGLVHQALHDAGFDRRPAVHDLLARQPAQLRWYAPLDADGQPDLSNGFWRGIPPDADSLGLMLQLGATLGGLPQDKALGWVAFLRASLGPDGRIPTWFYTAPDGTPSIQGPAWEYGSNDCVTARTTALTGLLMADLPDTRTIQRDNAALVADTFAAELDGTAPPGDFYYTPGFSELCYARLVRAWSGLRPRDPLAEHLGLVGARLARRILDLQQPDGGWGSAHESACRLETIVNLGAPRDPIARGSRFLAESQRPDGAWAAAPFYLMPGKSLASIEYHAAFELTTALCLRALSLSRMAAQRS